MFFLCFRTLSTLQVFIIIIIIYLFKYVNLCIFVCENIMNIIDILPLNIQVVGVLIPFKGAVSSQSQQTFNSVLNSVTEKYWLVHAAATVIWPNYHVG